MQTRLCGVREGVPVWLLWTHGLFSVGFTDISYCDGLDGKSVWNDHLDVHKGAPKTYCTLLEKHQCNLVVHCGVKLIPFTSFETVFDTFRLTFVWRVVNIKSLSLLGQNESGASIYANSNTDHLQTKTIEECSLFFQPMRRRRPAPTWPCSPASSCWCHSWA